ncbi:hypothetical protein GR160_11235 [Flavobacterium sp. Sd200]|uniref:hypothetical protein n=1 Tax=Flavobacterium sp. Sd200 TaxID=2692211 RepID=UPI0013696E66|nr:hypothetical protein [Flavobacterium sp. Sd200]MXN91799.1 hypothetical protein [Flavobacterium sp. Sd200]
MKKMLLATALLLGLAVNAQTKEKKLAEKPVIATEQKLVSITPEQRAEAKLKRLTTDLDLTEKQQKELKPTLITIETQKQANLEENRANKKAGKKLTEEQKDQRKIKALEQKMMLDKELKKILTADQTKKYDLLKEEKKDNLKNKKAEMTPSQK